MVNGSMRSPFCVRLPALEIAAPHPVGCAGRGERCRIRIHPAPLLTRNHQPLAAQKFADGAHCRPPYFRPLPFQNHLQLARSPTHMCLPQCHDLLLGLARRLMGMTMRRTAPHLQTLPALALIPRQRVVSRLTRDAVPATQFGHRPLPDNHSSTNNLRFSTTPLTFQGMLLCKLPSVNGPICQPCARSVLSTMSPVRTIS